MLKILITGGNGNIAKLCKSSLSRYYEIKNPSHKELDVLNLNELTEYLNLNNFDILIHTAILGGRRTKEENADVFYKNILMFENIMNFSNKFKMIINLDSGAIYDRNTDIFCRKEDELFTIPNDYYGLSKYIIYKRGLQYDNVYNLRIFNIFHKNEEPDRFIKSCFLADKNNTEIIIYEDKYFDFMYEDDFIKIVKYYIDNISSINLEKTINVCYEKKYKLSEIAELIIKDTSKIIIKNKESINNYCGDNSLLKIMNIDLFGLELSIILFRNPITF